MSKHDRFILTPITIEIQNAVSAMRSVDIGMEAFPISEYVMHSLFLKMTGFQEQKMKCVAWEMATEDFDFRRELLNNDLRLGEYSTLKAKNSIYKKLLDIIRNHIFIEIPKEDGEDNNGKKGKKDKKDNNKAHVVTDFIIKNMKIDKNQIIKNTLNSITESFDNTHFSVWDQRKYMYFRENGKKIITDEQFFNTDTSLLESELQKYYEELYRQRNRLAHNLVSYQENLPALIKLREENEDKRNFFIYLAILTLIDNIFIEVYKVFKDTLENSYYY